MVTRSNDSEVKLTFTSTHNINDGDSIAISGLSTYIKGLTKTHTVGVTTETLFLIADVASNATVGFVTDIYVSNVPEIISVGSTIGIGTERLEVLNVFAGSKVLRVARGLSGAGHTSSTAVKEVSNTITVPLNTKDFSSNVNEEYYFNAASQIGIGLHCRNRSFVCLCCWSRC